MTEENPGFEPMPQSTPGMQPPQTDSDTQMSEPTSLANIFFEPGRTFEWLRNKPKFIMAMLIMIVCTMAFQILFSNKIGDERMRRFVVEQIDKSPRAGQMDAAQKNQAIDLNMTISKYVRYAIPVFVVIAFLIGTLVYWLAAKAVGGNIGFMQTLSVWVYSAFPPTLISMLGNILILFLKEADDIDIASSQRGLIHANPSILFDGKEMPVLTTVISVLDVFAIWGWILAAIGLRVVGKLSTGAAWAVVLISALIGIAFRVFGAFMSGNPN